MIDPNVHPNEWADAAIKLLRGGGWVVPALVALWMLLRYWPWRKVKE